MENQISGTTENPTGQTEVDSWEAAFAALDSIGKENLEEPSDSNGDDAGGSDTDAGNAGEGEGLSDSVEAADSSQDEGDVGGLGSDTGSNGQENGNAFAGMLGVTEESIEKYESDLTESLKNQAINDIAQEFLKRNVRQKDGILGASLDDEDICKRDEDGVPHFYNPETGREFTGDNPRRQAQEWVNDYNQALADAFNKACTQYEKHLMEKAAPGIAVMKFALKYEKLDDIRRGMFDNVIEDYEIKDNDGKVVGYSCDLDKALALVERQISMIQSYAKQRQSTAQEEKPSGPALDMKTSSGAVASGEREAPKSLADAMEMLQDQQLEKMKR